MKRADMRTIRLALSAARRLVFEDRMMILESHCRLDKNLRPRLRTIDRHGRSLLRPVDRALARIDAALKLVR